jgi:hypothetical protein
MSRRTDHCIEGDINFSIVSRSFVYEDVNLEARRAPARGRLHSPRGTWRGRRRRGAAARVHRAGARAGQGQGGDA